MIEQGYNYLDSSIQHMIVCFETRIENLERFDNKKDSKNNQHNKSNKRRKYSNNNVSDEKSSKGTETGKKYCQYHGTCRHSTNECTLVKTLVQKEQKKKQKASKERKYTKHEINILVKKCRRISKRGKLIVQKNYGLLKT